MIGFSTNALVRVLVAAVTLVPVCAQTPEEQIKQLERDRQAAFVRGDIAGIERETADDYTTTNATGSVSDKPRMMASLSSGRTKILSVALEDLRARVYGEVAVLTGVYRDVSVSAGIERRTNARFTRVFAKRNGTWQAVAYQQTLIAE